MLKLPELRGYDVASGAMQPELPSDTVVWGKHLLGSSPNAKYLDVSLLPASYVPVGAERVSKDE